MVDFPLETHLKQTPLLERNGSHQKKEHVWKSPAEVKGSHVGQLKDDLKDDVHGILS
jgi:hypothetical protein